MQTECLDSKAQTGHHQDMRVFIFSLCFMVAGCSAQGPETVEAEINHPVIILETSAGSMEITVYPDKAPISAGDFLRYVDDKLYDAQGFYRTVHAQNDPLNMGMSLIQGGRLDKEIIFEPIAHGAHDRYGNKQRGRRSCDSPARARKRQRSLFLHQYRK